ncbi:MAG: hypothetical protein LBN30_09475 [Oscillospiraceae bacterium]|jgi:hypothetical protein|nr:hypothetical protein [Oscillospiraceae bacterium]
MDFFEQELRKIIELCAPIDDVRYIDQVCVGRLTEGQVFASVAVSVREGKTVAPRPYTEDTLLAAMETAGAEDMMPKTRPQTRC